MLLISSSQEKQTATKPRASRDREFYVNESQWGSESLRHRSGAEHFSRCQARVMIPSPSALADSLSSRPVARSRIPGGPWLRPGSPRRSRSQRQGAQLSQRNRESLRLGALEGPTVRPTRSGAVTVHHKQLEVCYISINLPVSAQAAASR